jgi:hypothetical protein
MTSLFGSELCKLAEWDLLFFASMRGAFSR